MLKCVAKKIKKRVTQPHGQATPAIYKLKQ